MDDEIAKLINRFGGEGIPENLRDVCADYFNSRFDSESDDSCIDEPARPDPEPSIQPSMEVSIEDIPIVFEVRILFSLLTMFISIILSVEII